MIKKIPRLNRGIFFEQFNECIAFALIQFYLLIYADVVLVLQKNKAILYFLLKAQLFVLRYGGGD